MKRYIISLVLVFIFSAGVVYAATLPVNQGGTGNTIFNPGEVLVGAGTNPLYTLNRDFVSNWIRINTSGLRLATTTDSVVIGRNSTTTSSIFEVHNGNFTLQLGDALNNLGGDFADSVNGTEVTFNNGTNALEISGDAAQIDGNFAIHTSPSSLFSMNVQGDGTHPAANFYDPITNNTATFGARTYSGRGTDTVRSWELANGTEAGKFYDASRTLSLLGTDLFNGSGGNLILTGGNVGLGTSTPGTLLSLGNTGNNTINISATATSTFGSGINIRAGCFSINNVCVGSGSGTVNSGVFGQTAFYGANGTAVSGTSTMVIGTTSADANNVGIGSTTPYYGLSVNNGPSYNTAYFKGSDASHGTQVIIQSTTDTDGSSATAPLILKDKNGTTVAYMRQDGGMETKFYSTEDNATVAVLENGGGAYGVAMKSDAQVSWAGSTVWFGGADTVLSRVAAGTVGVGTTGTGNYDATLLAAKIGIGTSSPYAALSVQSGASTGDAFVVSTTTKAAVFGIDNDGHTFTSGPAPAISVCGTGTGTVVGDDQSGTITTATAATACTMTFSKAYRNTPTCIVTDNSTVGFADISAISTTAVTFGISSALTGGNLYYSCQYHK